jgi:hypothetical protein
MEDKVMTHKSKRVQPQHWDLPAVDKAQGAMQYFFERPSGPAKVTLRFTIYNPSGWKRERLLAAHKYATDLQ